MAGNTVMRSIEAPGGAVCLDLFSRPDGSWGFEEYRRDPEDPHGWRPIGWFSNQRYVSEDAALSAAIAAIPWLSTDLP